MGDRVTGTPEEPWPVARLATELQSYVARLGAVWVEGELTQWNVRRGMVFGKVKDVDGDFTIDAKAFTSTLREPFAQGDRVVALVQPEYWAKGGTLSMQVRAMRHVGLGELLARIEELRQRLAAEGLFDPARKRPLPFLPHGVGLVTGRDSDAEQDVLRNARLRWPGVRFEVAYAAVQGDAAPREVVRAIEQLDANPDVDVIVVARGGGDFQALLAFSDERVLRAAAAAGTPIVSAIGHEADRPLLDLVADLRASTPTDAAKRVVPDVAEQLDMVSQARARIRTRVTQRVAHEVERLGALRSRPSLARPETLLDAHLSEVRQLAVRADDLAGRSVERAEHGIHRLADRLRALSPQATLDRGYAVVQTATGGVLRDAADATAGDAVLVTLASGTIDAEVTEARPAT